MNKKGMRSGFTLIELLVVISVITLLSSVVYVNAQDARVDARDTKKVVETQQIQKAITLYKEDNNTYPGVLGTVYRESEGAAFTQVFQDLVDQGYLGFVPDSPDDTHVYVNTGNAGVIQTSLEKGDGFLIPSTCSSGPGGFIAVGVADQGGGIYRVTYTIIDDYESANDYNYRVMRVNDFDPAAPDWTDTNYYVGTCSDFGCLVLTASWEFDYDPDTGVCISPDGGVAGEEYPIGTDLGRAFCERITDQAQFAYDMGGANICFGDSPYCSCTTS